MCNIQLNPFELLHAYIYPTNSLSSPALPALGNGLSGAAVAVLSNTVTYPLDVIASRVKIEALNEHEDERHENKFLSAARSIRNIVNHMYVNEGGISAFYAGILEDSGKTFVDSFLFFLAYTFLRQKHCHYKASSKFLHALDELTISVISDAFATFITTPAGILVLQKQTAMSGTNSRGRNVSSSSTKVTQAICSSRGLRGLWSGFRFGLLLTMSPALSFVLFETLKRITLPKKSRQDPSPMMTYVLSAFSKVVAISITYPILLARFKVQWSLLNSSSDAYTVKGTRVAPPEKSRKIPITQSLKYMLTCMLRAGLPVEMLKGLLDYGITILLKQRIYSLIVMVYFTLASFFQRKHSFLFRNPEPPTPSTLQSSHGTWRHLAGEAMEKGREVVEWVETVADENVGLVGDYIDDFTDLQKKPRKRNV